MYIDSASRPSYSAFMGEDGAHIRLKLDTNEPIALSDFVGSFVGLGSQFEKFVAREYPELKADAEFFVKDVRDGCIVADLVTMVMLGGVAWMNDPGFVNTIDRVQILSKFVNDLKGKIGKYFNVGGRESTANKSDLSDWLKTVQSISRDPKGGVNLESAVYEDGERKVRAAFRFTAKEANTAERELGDHRRELEARSGKDHSRMLLRFVRPSIEEKKLGASKGERAVVEKLHAKALPVVYASTLAEQRIHHEMMDPDSNVFRKLFDVDVNVETNKDGKPLAYRIMAVHSVIDAPEEGEAA